MRRSATSATVPRRDASGTAPGRLKGHHQRIAVRRSPRRRGMSRRSDVWIRLRAHTYAKTAFWRDSSLSNFISISKNKRMEVSLQASPHRPATVSPGTLTLVGVISYRTSVARRSADFCARFLRRSMANDGAQSGGRRSDERRSSSQGVRGVKSLDRPRRRPLKAYTRAVAKLGDLEKSWDPIRGAGRISRRFRVLHRFGSHPGIFWREKSLRLFFCFLADADEPEHLRGLRSRSRIRH